MKLHDNASTQEQPAKRQRQASGVTMPEPITNITAAPGSVCTNRTSVPYIGVGLEVYCAVEPCLMCAMALVHSRVSRVVYRLPLQVSRYLDQNEATASDPVCTVSLFHSLLVTRLCPS